MIQSGFDDLKRKCYGKKVILDTSFVLPRKGLVKTEYSNPISIAPISEETLKEKKDRINQVDELSNVCNLVLLNESYNELYGGVTCAEGQRLFYERCFRTGEVYTSEHSDGFSQYVESVRKLMKKLYNEKFNIHFNNTHSNSFKDLNDLLGREKNRLLGSLGTDAREKMQKKWAGKDYLTTMREEDHNGEIEVPFDKYIKFLQMSFVSSRDLEKESLERALGRDSSCIGYISGTDRKITATAYGLSYSSGVMILTMDKGIRTLVGRVRNFSYNPDHRRYFKLESLPQNYLGVFDPSGYVTPVPGRKSPSYK